jgi:hypothetical protein
VLPGIACPCLGGRIIRRIRTGVELPDFLPGVNVKGSDKTVRAHIVGRRSDDDHVLYHQRGDVELIALSPVRSRNFPCHAAGPGIDGEQMIVPSRRPKQGVPLDCYSLVDQVHTLHMEIVRIKRTREFPVLPARGGIERHHFGQARRI